ncbi:ABC transporter substrate binding protein [Ancylomarina sp. 16SWW S1-10-2]|uniref:sensor histidine kinase n=1 Tax=Ancylomarina sp. 16SWW S1-10-2 TaxID=2499681 RepID=UPI0012AD4F47|nr:ABC transporter substrate binding protein [Ancylomarina sp. 16SWW S1-10-2]MRT94091.1 PAS domain S-box protein [Ancylomarina sp. 16SWW S1-10-2]
MRYLFLSFLFVLASLTSAFAIHPSIKSKKHILVIHSYHQSFAWTDSISNGIESVLTPLENEVETYYEYLDSKRFVDPTFIESFDQKYKLLCSKLTFDVIIVSDNNALNFVIKSRKRCFKNIPIIFCGINNYKPELLMGEKRVTGIAEYTAIDSTLMLMHKLQPKRKILIINDKTVTGLANKSIIMDALPELEKDIFIEYSDNGNMKDIQEKVRNLSDDWMIYLAPFSMDSDGNYYSFSDAVRLVSEASAVPIYSSWDFYLGKGIVGGYITSGVLQGKLAGEMALSIVKGVNPDTIPVLKESAVSVKIDHSVLSKFKISESNLTKGTIIINREKTLFEKHIVLFKNIMIIGFVLVFLLIIYSVFKHRQKKVLERQNLELDRKVEDRSRELLEANENLSRKNLEITKQEELSKLAYLRLKAILNNSLVGIVVTDGEGKIIDQNNRISEILDYQKGELLGKDIMSTFLNKSNYNILMSEYEQLEGSKAFIRNEIPLKRVDNSVIWAKIYISEMLYSYSDDANIWVVDDVSEIVENRANLEKRTSELKKINETKDQFFSIISQDLKGPLTSAVGLLEVFTKSSDSFSDLEIKKYVKNCYESVHNISDLLDNLLRWGSIQIGGVPWNPNTIDMRNIVDTVLNTFETIAKVKSIELKNNISLNLNAFGDENMIKTVVSNLVNNAIKFTRKNGLVDVSAEIENNRIEILVRDNGIGIEREDVQHLFDINKKTQHEGTSKESGSGLGLVIAKDLVEKNKGSIRVESDINVGTRVYFDLPIEAPTS